MVIYRRPQLGDFDQMVALQRRNLISALDPLDREDGFLATAFTAKQFQEIDNSLGIFVAVDEDKVCGYLCASTPAFNQNFPIPKAMLERCATLFYHGQRITNYRYVIASPACIEKSYRRTYVFLRLAERILSFISNQHELILTLISEKNTQSLHSAQKMGMEIIDQFDVEEQRFYILVRLVLADNFTSPCSIAARDTLHRYHCNRGHRWQ
jgi:hypothetical protein